MTLSFSTPSSKTATMMTHNAIVFRNNSHHSNFATVARRYKRRIESIKLESSKKSICSSVAADRMCIAQFAGGAPRGLRGTPGTWYKHHVFLGINGHHKTLAAIADYLKVYQCLACNKTKLTLPPDLDTVYTTTHEASTHIETQHQTETRLATSQCKRNSSLTWRSG